MKHKDIPQRSSNYDYVLICKNAKVSICCKFLCLKSIDLQFLLNYLKDGIQYCGMSLCCIYHKYITQKCNKTLNSENHLKPGMSAFFPYDVIPVVLLLLGIMSIHKIQ